MTRPTCPSCTPFVSRYFPSKSAWVHSLECPAVEDGMRLAGQRVREPEGGSSSLPASRPRPRYYSERDQDEHEHRRLADYGCSKCGVTQLPHLEDCETHGSWEVGKEYAREVIE